MAAGAVILILLFLVVFHFYQKQNPAEQLAFKASRVDLVSRMQSVLASASEAEKSAVLAVTDQDSQAFAGQARTAAAEVERARRELGELLKLAAHEARRSYLTNSLNFSPSSNASITPYWIWQSRTPTLRRIV